MATFEDNTAVTLADLNNIAVDLGDTTFSAFSEEKFGVDKLNEITSDLVSKGILTTGNRCEAIVSGGKVYIQSGVIVFESGAKIRIEDPVAVDLVNGSYIYAVNNLLTGKANIEVGDSLPTSGDYVSIAQVDNAGEIVDLRGMAVAKLTLSAEVENKIVYQTETFNLTQKTWCEFPVSPKLSACQVFILKSKFHENYGYCMGIELSEDYQDAYEYTYSTNSAIYVQVKKVDGLLYFKVFNAISSGDLQVDFILA